MSLRSAKITATHFVWNQDEAAQNSRYADKYYYKNQAQRSDIAPLLWFQTLIRCNFYSLHDTIFSCFYVVVLARFLNNFWFNMVHA